MEFGGPFPFRPFYKPEISINRDEGQKSFPSGHATMGFYFLSLVLVGRRYKNSPLLYSGVILSIFWGGGLMIVRIAQGGHFLSDTIASALIMWLVALLADRIAFRNTLQKSL